MERNNDHMDLNRDEMRRTLQAIDADNRAVMPKWYDALARILGGGSNLSIDDKAAILGVPAPGRRQFFAFGASTIMGAAVLAACGSDSDSGAGGDNAAETTTTALADNLDIALARTAASIEKLAIDTYQSALDSGLLTTPAIVDTAKLFQSHHQAHFDGVNKVVKAVGGTPVSEANEAIFKALVEPPLQAATSEAALVKIALELELAAAQTYVYAGGALSSMPYRSTIMTIGGIEARHAAVLIVAGQSLPAPAVFPDDRAFFPGENPVASIQGAVLSG